MSTLALREGGTPAATEIGEAREAVMVATLTAEPTRDELTAVAGMASCLEVRADLAGDLDAGWLREHFAGTLIYALRSGGRGRDAADSGDERHRRLLAAAEQYEIVDLEHPNDLTPDLLGRIPPERRRVSWHGAETDLTRLAAQFEQMATVPAQLYELATAITSIDQGLAPLRLLKRLGRTDVSAFATGPLGSWTRLLAPRLGAPVAYGRVGDRENEGAPSLEQLSGTYGLPAMQPLSTLYGIVGESVSYSLAPRMLNKALRALDLRAAYLPFSTADFGLFWRDVVQKGLPELGLPLGGLTVVRPHKEEALSAATTATIGAERAGAANLLVRSGGTWRAANTSGVVDPLSRAGVDPAGHAAAVVGCGGAGRSVAAELRRYGATVTLVNRGTPRGAYASSRLGLPWIPLSDFSPRRFDLVVNATSLGTESPFDVADLAKGAAVVDLVYLVNEETALAAAARARGLTVVDGRHVLVAELERQFQLMTERSMPPGAVAVARHDHVVA